MPEPLHFLLIDDSPADQFLAQEAFERLCPDCALTCAGSGREALALMQEADLHPDVVLLDINMPGMNGFEVLQAMKAEASLVRIPVVMLSTSTGQADISQAYTLHASSYLVKSVDFDNFLRQIDTFLRYWQASRLALARRDG